jgi:hypothetical protein
MCLLIGVVTRTHQRTAGRVPETQFYGDRLEALKLRRLDVAQHG